MANLSSTFVLNRTSRPTVHLNDAATNASDQKETQRTYKTKKTFKKKHVHLDDTAMNASDQKKTQRTYPTKNTVKKKHVHLNDTAVNASDQKKTQRTRKTKKTAKKKHALVVACIDTLSNATDRNETLLVADAINASTPAPLSLSSSRPRSVGSPPCPHPGARQRLRSRPRPRRSKAKNALPRPALRAGTGQNITSVFWRGLAGKYCYRIPVVIRTCQGGLVAFAERRAINCRDYSPRGIVSRRSMDDGASWGDVRVVVPNGKGSKPCNPNPVELKLVDTSQQGALRCAILLHYSTLNNPHARWHGTNMQAWSYDGGSSWTNFRDIGASMPRGYRGCLPGPSVGVVAQGGAIFFSCHGFGPKLFLYWSKDDGQTWKHSKVLKGLDECSLAMLPDGKRLGMNCRTTKKRRAQLTWQVSNATSPKVVARSTPTGLIDPGCQGSLISIGRSLLLSSANSSGVGDNQWGGRWKVTVRHSEDDGGTWDVHTKPVFTFQGPSAYSQLVHWCAGGVGGRAGGRGVRMIGLLFEHGKKNYRERIGFAKWAHTRTDAAC